MRQNALYAAGLAGCFLLLTLAYRQMGYLENIQYRVRGYDSVFYYVWLPSAVFDRDLDFTNDLAVFGWDRDTWGISPKNLPKNFSPIGTALAWAPLMGLAHLVELSRDGPPDNGYGPVYYAFIYVGNALFALFGVILSFFWISRYTGKKEAFLGACAILFASQLTYYFWSFTAMSHNASLLATALFLLAFQRRGLSPVSGLAAGFMVLVRWNNAIFLIFPLVASLYPVLKDKKRARDLVRPWTVFSLFFLGVFSLQMLAWKAVYGSFLAFPSDPGQVDPFRLQFLKLLFSTRHGLYSWHPLLLAGTLGLFLLRKKNKALFLGLFTALAAQIFFQASLADWHAAWAFGARRFVHMLPVFGLGLALIAQRFGKPGFLGAALLVLVFGFWNQLFIFQYQKNLIPPNQALSPRQMVWDKFSLGKILHGRSLANQALAHADRSGPDAAFAEMAEKAHEMAPDDSRARAAMALACLYSGFQKPCVVCLESLYKKNTGDPAFAWAFAAMLLQDGQKDRARDILLSATLPLDEESLRREFKEKIFSSLEIK